MKSNFSRIALMGVLVLALSVTVGLVSGSVADAKKKKKSKGGTQIVTKTVNAAIPDATTGPTGQFGKLAVPIDMGGKKLKKKVVSNVTVTLQTTGATASAAGDLSFRLVSPTGRALFVGPDLGGIGGQSIGPLTLSPNSPVGTCNTATPPCENPDQTLNRPFAGTAGDAQLAQFNGSSASGTWTFVAYDTDNGDTSVLNSVKLAINAVNPPQ